MKFLVTRSSHAVDGSAPVDEAVQEPYVQTEYASEAVNGWFVEIASLDDLVAFGDKYGPIIVQAYHANPDIREIEIYDDWRE